MRLADFDYDLPPERIAQTNLHPVPEHLPGEIAALVTDWLATL